jgi:hypothetical protein
MSEQATITASDLVEHGGKWWRKVRREAQVGELVLVLDSHPASWYRGKVFRRCMSTKLPDGHISFEGENGGAFARQYVVLEPLTLPTAQLSVNIAVDGKPTLLIADLPPIALDDVCEMIARGAAARAKDELDLLEQRMYKAIDDLRESASAFFTAHDEVEAQIATDKLTLMADWMAQAAHWHAEYDRWGGELDRITEYRAKQTKKTAGAA